jgi:ATP-dependent Clp protease ATP-binding subunit ClpB
MKKLLGDRQLTLELTDAAKDLLAERGYDPVYGARPLKRAIQKDLQDPLALKVLKGEFVPGDTVQVDAGKDALHFNKVARA